jgi:hypothetical protein
VVGVDIWHDTVSLRGPEGDRRTLTLEQLKSEVGQPGSRRGEGDGA